MGGENPAVGAELCTCSAGAKAKAHAKQNAAGAEDAEDRGERKIGIYWFLGEQRGDDFRGGGEGTV